VTLASSWGAFGDADDQATLIIGADDAQVGAGRSAGPLAVLPAVGPRRPDPWAAALCAAADVVLLLDPVEALDLRSSLADRAVIASGLPAPPDSPPGRGLEPGDAPAYVREAWAAELAASPADGPGVAWIWGRGVAPLAAALEAWSAGRAIVALPGTVDHEILRRGGVLRTESSLEVVEATRFLLDAPPLVAALAARGKTELARRPSEQAAATRLVEAVEVARVPVAS
jgi:hypothetical protein